jgi:NAD(P)H-nitrite reductase large subunit
MYNITLFCKQGDREEILAFLIEHTQTYYMTNALMREKALINAYRVSFETEEKLMTFKNHLTEHYDYERADKFTKQLEEWSKNRENNESND